MLGPSSNNYLPGIAWRYGFLFRMPSILSALTDQDRSLVLASLNKHREPGTKPLTKLPESSLNNTLGNFCTVLTSSVLTTGWSQLSSNNYNHQHNLNLLCIVCVFLCTTMRNVWITRFLDFTRFVISFCFLD